MSKEDLVNKAKRAVLEGDEELAVEVANQVVAEGINPVDIINVSRSLKDATFLNTYPHA